MVTLYVGGKAVKWAEAEAVFAAAARTEQVEFRDDAGGVIATTAPAGGPLVPWDPSLTQADVDRAAAGPFLTLEEWRAQGCKP